MLNVSEYGKTVIVSVGCELQVEYQYSHFEDPKKNICRIIKVDNIPNPYAIIKPEIIGRIKIQIHAIEKSYRDEALISVLHLLK
jgi:hypothetical protein